MKIQKKRKLFKSKLFIAVAAAQLCAATLGLPASALFNGMTLVDGKGMQIDPHFGEDCAIYLNEYGKVILLKREERKFIFYVNPVCDSDETRERIRVILNEHFPESNLTGAEKITLPSGAEAYPVGIGESESIGRHYYTVVDNVSDMQELEENVQQLKKELAAEGLISKFTELGSGGRYEEHWPDFLAFTEYHLAYFGVTLEEVEQSVKDAGVSAVITSDETKYDTTIYRVVPDEPMDAFEKFALCTEIYEATGLEPFILSGGVRTLLAWSTEGDNSLLQAGDVNVDTEVDIRDAILMSRLVTEDQTLRLSDTSIANADFNADGAWNADDLALLLEKLAGA